MVGINYELLLRHILETQIHIQTQILKSFILSLATSAFVIFGITTTWVKLPKYQGLKNLSHVSSVQDTQKTLSIHFFINEKSKKIFQKSLIFLIICGVPPTPRQTQWNLKIRAHNSSVTSLVPKILRNLYLLTFDIG